MQIGFRTLYLKKRFPLRISRGEIAGGENLFVSVTDGALTGWGEMAPGPSEGAGTPAEGQTMLEKFCQDGLTGSIHDIWAAAHAAGCRRPVAALSTGA